MWIRVISLRSRTARMLYLFLAFVVLSFILHPRVPAASQGGWIPALAPVYRVETSQPAVALTFNIVWGTEYVPQILQVLRSHHASATFMVGGAWAKAHPDLLRTIAADKMEIGNHGYSHRHSALLSVAQNLSEINRTNAEISAITGHTPTLFAPPYGEFNQTVVKAAEMAHMTLVMWTLDTIDWRPSSTPAVITSRVLKRIRPGAIVLMHPTDRTVEALPAILKGLDARGLKTVTVSRLMESGVPKGEGQ